MEQRETLSLKMDHPNLDREPIAEHYVLGKLGEEERRAFEEHFIDCPRCLEAIETSRSQAEAWKGLTREEIAAAFPRTAPRRRGLFAFPAGVRRGAALLLAAALVLSILSAAFFYREMRRADRALASAEAAWRGARERSAERLRARARSAGERSVLDNVLAATPGLAMVVTLDVTRGGEPETATPIAIDGQSGWVVLLFDRPEARGVRRYRASLQTTEGQSAAPPAPITPGRSEMLAAAFPARTFVPGEYLLEIEGASDDQWEALARYRLRVPSPSAGAPAR